MPTSFLSADIQILLENIPAISVSECKWFFEASEGDIDDSGVEAAFLDAEVILMSICSFIEVLLDLLEPIGGHLIILDEGEPCDGFFLIGCPFFDAVDVLASGAFVEILVDDVFIGGVDR